MTDLVRTAALVIYLLALVVFVLTIAVQLWRATREAS